jgi:hypothetical protein
MQAQLLLTTMMTTLLLLLACVKVALSSNRTNRLVGTGPHKGLGHRSSPAIDIELQQMQVLHSRVQQAAGGPVLRLGPPKGGQLQLLQVQAE